MRLSTHSQRLERWLTPAEVEHISANMRDWYGPPIAVGRVPGAVYAYGGGDFRGRIDAGSEASLMDRAADGARRMKRVLDRMTAKQVRRAQFATGFASLSDLIAEATAGKTCRCTFNKVGTTGVVAATSTLWYVGNQPAAGANGAAAPGGTAMTSATTGALPFNNPSGADTTHFLGGMPIASAVNTLLMYDRLFSVTKTMNSTSTEAVTGVPTRYQSTTAGAQDSAEGNFLMVEIRTALAATAHNWTTCLYTDQSGNGSATLPSVTGLNGGIVNRLDQPTGSWFCPLASGDNGIKELDQMQCSAAVATGAVDFTIGHPIGWLPCPVANIGFWADGVGSMFDGLTRIFDSACLAFLEVTKPATAATTYSGMVTLGQG